MVEEEGDGWARRRALFVKNSGGGKGECEIGWGKKSAGEVGGGGYGNNQGGEYGIASAAEGVSGESSGGGR